MKDTIYAVADGYISRINVRPDGYGNAVYIDHPNGYTSVYAHLARFSPELISYIESIMYEEEVYAIEHYPKENAIPVKKGTPIGLMGNTGRSSGVHLHFELRETDSEIPVNPALHQIKPEDSRFPTIRGVMLYNVLPDGEVWHKEYHNAIYEGDGKYRLKNGPIKSGSLLIGVGIHAYDTMNGARNHNGIYGLRSVVNGSERFAFQLDKVGFDVSAYLHAHMDYEEKVNNRYVTKCFRNALNPLPFYRTDEYNGLVSLFEAQPAEIAIEVYDFEGNQSILSFEVERDSSLQPFGQITDSTFQRVDPGDSIIFDLNDILLEIRPNTFVEPVSLRFEDATPQNIDLSQTLDFPIFRSMKLGATFEYAKGTKEKYIFSSTDKKGKIIHEGGEWENDSTLVTYISSFGEYKVVRDVDPPIVEIRKMPSQNNPVLKFVLKDNYEPSRRKDEVQFSIKVDNRWRLCQHDIKFNMISCDFSSLKSGSEHELVIEAIDAQENASIVTRTFKL